MASSTKLPLLTEPQLEAMRVVWQHDEITVSEVWQAIAARRAVARNTILTVLDRLEKRGWLLKRTVGNVQLYRAAVTEKATLSQAVQRLVNTFFGGSPESLMMTLLEGRGVSPEEARRIRQQIEKARAKRS